MSTHNDFNNIGQLYGKMLGGMKHKLIREGKIKPPVKQGEIGEAPLQKGGPTEKGGFKPIGIDKRKLSPKELEDNLYDIDRLSDDTPAVKKKVKKTSNKKSKVVKETTKIAQDRLNNFMRRKSIFDKLYENVMNGPEQGAPMGASDDMDMSETEELDALGVDTEGEGDEVTLTLDRETASKLHDILMSALGDETEDLEGEDLEGEDLEGEEDYEVEGEEAEEDEEDLGHTGVNAKEPNFGKNNKVGSVKPRGGQASSAYTNKVGNDGDLGHALVNAKEPNMGKNNKVGSLKTGKSLFDQ